ncbi:MAG: hypothetical protein ACT4NL_02865 [Pseudomarimonas sp.]
MSRWKAAGIHFVLTVVIVTSLATLMLTTWYAKGMFQFSNADRLLLVLAGIDVVVGPLLTLIIFRSGKPRLKFDLAFIGLAQAAFLLYGLHVIWQSRPVFLVALPERYALVFANEVRDSDLKSEGVALPRSRLPWFGPELVGSRLPDDVDTKQKLIDEFIGGRDLHVFPEYYLPFESVAPDLVASSEPLSSLAALRAESERTKVTASLGRGENVRWVPIMSSRGIAVMVIDPTSGAPIKVLPIDPLALPKD